MHNHIGRTQNISKAPIVHLLSSSKIPEGTISLGQGAPFYGPPESAISAVFQALKEKSYYGYTEDMGREGLRKAISDKLRRKNEINADFAHNIMVTSGGNYGFMIALLSISNLGDEIILTSPYYFNHKMAIEMVGCKPVIVYRDHDHQPVLQNIIDATTSKTRGP